MKQLLRSMNLSLFLNQLLPQSEEKQDVKMDGWLCHLSAALVSLSGLLLQLSGLLSQRWRLVSCWTCDPLARIMSCYPDIGCSFTPSK